MHRQPHGTYYALLTYAQLSAPKPTPFRSGDRCGDPKTVKALLSKSTKLEQLRHPSRLGEHDDKPSQKECQAFFSRFVEHIRAL